MSEMISSEMISVELEKICDPDLQQLNAINQLFLSTDKEAHQPILAYLNSRYGVKP
jgi:hypothetical protein